MTARYRPLVQHGPARPQGALPLAGGTGWFTQVEQLDRRSEPRILNADKLPDAARRSLTAPRAPVAGLRVDQAQVMGILNVTPDSFSDGGRFDDTAAAAAHGKALIADGAAILDIGGESTRPGAEIVPENEEIRRTAPVIAALRAAWVTAPISIDTRKAAVAAAAIDAGASLVNDVSGFTFDADLAPLCAERGVPVCVMHAQGDPATMQDDPQYDDVLLDVFDFLSGRIAFLEAAGIPRARIVADPGIGFGKTQAHNLALLRRLSLFHGLGVPILLGASRKRFIGTLSGVADAAARVHGSIGVTLAALGHGIQLHRVHDVKAQSQAIALWRAAVAETDP